MLWSVGVYVIVVYSGTDVLKFYLFKIQTHIHKHTYAINKIIVLISVECSPYQLSVAWKTTHFHLRLDESSGIIQITFCCLFISFICF